MLWFFTKVGSFGVDLFFALSGFLIGSLFFQEKNVNGTVDISRFILRRISRTVPPYFLALLVSYLAVYIYREEPFDFGYLLFFQNYYQELPFFLISWSLCVEEHFYLVLPVMLTILFAIFKESSVRFMTVLFLMSLAPLLLRLEYQQIQEKHFGYYVTATHLNYDPLILGVLFAYISIYFNSIMRYLLKYKSVIYLLTGSLLLSYSWWSSQWMYSVGSYLLALSFAITVAISCVDKPWSISNYKIVTVIATSSYAIYLVHTLVLHALEMIFNLVEVTSVFLQLSSMIVIACCIGYAFYFVIEKPLMAWRKKRIPSYRTINREKDYASANS